MPSRLAGRAATALLIAAIVPATAGAASATGAVRCPGADSTPDQISYAALGRATRCLVNRERRARGLVPLRPNARLAVAARWHARDMVRHTYFGHNSRSGERFTARISRSGYLRGAARWLVGENLAWGGGAESTPRWTVRLWMRSPPHRANILTPRFRDIGVAAVPGVPVREGYRIEATYVHEFGVRR